MTTIMLPKAPELLKYYQLDKHPIFVLGSFASRVTFYTQQVRALNLIWALHEAGLLKDSSNIAVIGAGAAGLTAAAAALHLRAKVTVLDRLRPIDLQRNNRQRWLHPNIYDWPYLEENVADLGVPQHPALSHGEANLPLLNWRADSAANVARYLLKRWKWLKAQNGTRLNEISTAEVDDIELLHQECFVKWHTPGQPLPTGEKFDFVIVAVGFGIEERTEHSHSYWSEDDIDRSGQDGESSTRQKWLVSGDGDGALIDLMRLCIREFRYEDIVTRIDHPHAREELKKHLRLINKKKDQVEASEEFERIYNTEIMRHLLSDQDCLVERGKREVVLMSQSGAIYGGKTSVLNRLIVLWLHKNDYFALQKGTTKEVWRVLESGEQTGTKETPAKAVRYLVAYQDQSNVDKYEFFDRVLKRHGPKPRPIDKFPQIKTSCGALEGIWKKIPVEEDQTRIPQWTVRHFGIDAPVPQAEPVVYTPTTTPGFYNLVSKYGVLASSLTVIKNVNGDSNGGSIITYEVRGLQVFEGKLIGLRFLYRSPSGNIGSPQIDSQARLWKFKWMHKPEEVSDPVKALGSVAEARSPTSDISVISAAHYLSGEVRFPEPIEKGSLPVSFAMSFSILNGDALSYWEFENMYAEKDRDNFECKDMSQDIHTERWYQTVWFPVEALRMRLTLPANAHSSDEVTPSVLAVSDKNEIVLSDVIENSVLRTGPARNSKWHPKNQKWQKESTERLREDGALDRLPRTNTWELAVRNPAVGTCYALAWKVAARESSPLALRTKQYWKRLLVFREKRDELPIREPMFKLYSELDLMFGEENTKTPLGVSLMTYDEEKKSLVVVDSVLGGETDEAVFTFSLPFGLGLSGASFKLGQFLGYFAEEAEEERRLGPDPYIAFPDRKNEFLLAFPLTFDFDKDKDVLEPSQSCIGIVNVQSNSLDRARKAKSVLQEPEKREVFEHLCGVFGEKLRAI